MKVKSSGKPDVYRDELPAFLCRVRPAGHAIYVICMTLVSAMLISLPLIRVPVTVSGQGVIRAYRERSAILSPVSGIVQEVYVRQGADVESSAPLVKIKSAGNQHRLRVLQAEKTKLEAEIKDLRGMLHQPPESPVHSRHQQAFGNYLTELEYRRLLFDKADLEHARQKGLYHAGLISAQQFDDLTFNMKKREMEMQTYISRTRKEWQSLAEEKKIELSRMEAEIEHYREDLALHTILATSRGNLVEFREIAPGTVVQAGEQLGVLSPAGPLMGTFYVPSSDIGLLRKNMPVNIHLEAFPSREWGTISGSVTHISEDCLFMDKGPYFQIDCKLHEGALQRIQDRPAGVRKGMGFHAQCLVAKRSLLQLLTDRMHRWMNPVFGKTDQIPAP